ncbi:MAG: RimK-like ATPgrasp N-terminal domain-containing protein, partial [Candidatus Competibacterales bacterium]|nr:RimK-like ATPgrasp N-terminal domain-containing protein [Candidatus Competibacterales bacterium]
CTVKPLADLARQLFDTFRAPLLRVEFRLAGKWRLHAVRPLHLHGLDPEQEARFIETLEAFLSKRWRRPRARRQYRYDLAVLHNPEEALPPSDRQALAQLVKAGRAQGVDVELIERRDFNRLAEFDALFIRETTAIDHYTYQFAKKAEREGMVVIDDPDSILRCTNKIYLEELLRTHRVPTPRTVIVGRDTLEGLDRQLDYPIVLKIPDGSFSRGVFKAENRSELTDRAQRLFKTSELILAQEYLYTEFDWRIGVLARKPLYACQYFMSKAHWQIYNHAAGKRGREGAFATLAMEETPPAVVDTALKAAQLVGNSLYGVDLKQTETGVVVIEVNDNPNIDAGVEDRVLGPELYRRLIGEFRRRLDAR